MKGSDWNVGDQVHGLIVQIERALDSDGDLFITVKDPTGHAVLFDGYVDQQYLENCTTPVTVPLNTPDDIERFLEDIK